MLISMGGKPEICNDDIIFPNSSKNEILTNLNNLLNSAFYLFHRKRPINRPKQSMIMIKITQGRIRSLTLCFETITHNLFVIIRTYHERATAFDAFRRNLRISRIRINSTALSTNFSFNHTAHSHIFG